MGSAQALHSSESFHEAQPIGRVSTGKPQLRLDEAKRYREAALRLFAQNRDRFALTALIPINRLDFTKIPLISL